MKSTIPQRAWLGALFLALPLPLATAQAPRTLDDLAALEPAQLNAIFDQAAPGSIPQGKVRGQAIVFPGRPIAGPASRASRLYWQGKVFDPADSTAINKFVGLPMVRSQVSYGPSLRDGRTCIVLDYSATSLVYRNVRDELREVSPGLYLGLMYRTTPNASFVRFFAFEDR